MAGVDPLRPGIRVLSAFVTYDRRQTSAVQAAGIPVAAPGRG